LKRKKDEPDNSITIQHYFHLKRSDKSIKYGFDIEFNLNLIIKNTTPNSIAHKVGLKPGDKIIEINDKKIEAMQCQNEIEQCCLNNIWKFIEKSKNLKLLIQRQYTSNIKTLIDQLSDLEDINTKTTTIEEEEEEEDSNFSLLPSMETMEFDNFYVRKHYSTTKTETILPVFYESKQQELPFNSNSEIALFFAKECVIDDNDTSIAHSFANIFLIQ
jgi:hypothetical protein